MHRYVLTARGCSEAWKRTRATRSADKARRVRVERSHLRRRRAGFRRRRTPRGGLSLHAARIAGALAAARATAGAARGHAARPPCALLARLRAFPAYALGNFFDMLMKRSVHLAYCRRSSRSTCTASLSSRRGAKFVPQARPSCSLVLRTLASRGHAAVTRNRKGARRQHGAESAAITHAFARHAPPAASAGYLPMVGLYTTLVVALSTHRVPPTRAPPTTTQPPRRFATHPNRAQVADSGPRVNRVKQCLARCPLLRCLFVLPIVTTASPPNPHAAAAAAAGCLK